MFIWNNITKPKPYRKEKRKKNSFLKTVWTTENKINMTVFPRRTPFKDIFQENCDQSKNQTGQRQCQSICIVST
jgi:hypothetical protein